MVLSSNITNFAYTDFASANGYDLRFTDASGSIGALAAWSPLAWIVDRAAGAANDGLALAQPVATSFVLLGLGQIGPMAPGVGVTEVSRP